MGGYPFQNSGTPNQNCSLMKFGEKAQQNWVSSLFDYTSLRQSSGSKLVQEILSYRMNSITLFFGYLGSQTRPVVFLDPKGQNVVKRWNSLNKTFLFPFWVEISTLRTPNFKTLSTQFSFKTITRIKELIYLRC
jgi:hypothetical protein